MSDELRIGSKDRVIVLVLKPKVGDFRATTKTKVIGVEGPFSVEAKAAIGTLYDWLESAKAKA